MALKSYFKKEITSKPSLSDLIIPKTTTKKVTTPQTVTTPKTEEKTSLLSSINKGISKIGETVGGIATEFVTAPQKAGTQLGLYASKKLTGEEKTYKPQTKIGKAMLGEEVKDVEKTGQEYLTGFGLQKETAEKYGLGTGLVFATLDLLPATSGEAKLGTKAIKMLAKEKDVAKIAKVLKTTGASDDVIKPLAEKISKTSNTKIIKNSIDDLTKQISEAKITKEVKPTVSKIEDIKPQEAVTAKKAETVAKEETLIEEAKKYNSAEEFVKSQSLYHGTSEKIIGGKLSFGVGTGLKKGGQSGGLFLTDNPNISNVFGKNIYQADASIKKDVLDLTKENNINKFRKYIGNKYNTMEGDFVEFTEYDFENMFPNGTADFASISQYPELVEKVVKENKLIGIAFNEYAGGEIGKTYQILKGNIPVKTKQQLIDIWNKANKPQKATGTIKPTKLIEDTGELKKTITKAETKEIKKKIVNQKFNKEKLNLSDDLTSQVDKRRSALGLETREVRTFEDMSEAAQELGVDPENLLKDITEKRITDKEVVGLRNLINNNAEFITKTEREILENPKNEVLLRQKINIAEQQIDQSLKKLVKGGTEAGRAVASYRIMANQTLEPQFWFTKAQKVLGNRELTSEMKQAILDLTKKSDRQGLANYVSMLRKPSFAEKAITLWKAGLLTSPTTHLANIGGNLTMSALNTASDVVATGFDILSSLATGKRTTTISPKIIYSEIKGLKEGIGEAKKYMKTGIYADDLVSKYDIPRQVNFDNKVLNGYTQAIFRSLGGEDLLFRKAAMSKSLEKQANIIAINEKLGGVAKKERIAELLQNPTNDMVMNAIDAAEYATFQNKNVLADIISGAKRGVAGKSEIGGAALEVVAPFTKTPTNIASRIAEYSPAGFVKAMVDIAKPATRSQEKFVNQIAKATTGSGVIAFGAYLADKGLMTGNLPASKSEREQFYAEGKQPNSIRIGDKWYKLNKLSPFGNLLSLGAEFDEMSKEKEGTELVTATAAEGLKGLTEQTFLKGVSGGLKAVTEPERYAESFLESTVASVVPSVIGRTARTIDPTMRVPDGIMQSIQSKIPGKTQELPARRDIWGEKVEVAGGKLNLIDPFSTKQAVDDPIINEAKSIGVTIGMPSETVNGVKLDNYEYDDYSKVVGKLRKKYLETLINSEEYKGLSNTEKEKSFNKALRDVKSSIDDYIFPALMIKRYDLPTDTNPEILTQLITELNKNDDFKKATEDKKAKVIKNLISKIGSQT